MTRALLMVICHGTAPSMKLSTYGLSTTEEYHRICKKKKKSLVDVMPKTTHAAQKSRTAFLTQSEEGINKL